MTHLVSIQINAVIDNSDVIDNGLAGMDVELSATGKVGVCRVVFDDPLGLIRQAALVEKPIYLEWSFNNDEPQRIFTGTIDDVKYPHRGQVRIVAFDDFRKLQTEKQTLTLEEQPPEEMAKFIVGEKLGLDVSGIEESEFTLDKLPLFKRSAAEALGMINQRLNLKHDFYLNEDGVFVWKARDYEQEPSFDFEVGYDLLFFSLKEKRLATWARAVKLGQVVSVLDFDGAEYRLFVTGLHHSLPKTGSRTEVFFEVIENEHA